MDYIIKFVSDYWLIIFIVMMLFVSSGWFVTLQGKELRRKFEALGEVEGKMKEDIIAAVGPPSSISAVGDGKTLCQWMKTGFDIGLIFDGKVCEGISHMTDVSDV